MDKQSRGTNVNGAKRKKLTNLDEIVHRHLNDEHDKITEDDIRNANVGFPKEVEEIEAGSASTEVPE